VASQQQNSKDSSTCRFFIELIFVYSVLMYAKKALLIGQISGVMAQKCDEEKLLGHLRFDFFFFLFFLVWLSHGFSKVLSCSSTWEKSILMCLLQLLPQSRFNAVFFFFFFFFFFFSSSRLIVLFLGDCECGGC
jgi:hypothetical protein